MQNCQQLPITESMVTKLLEDIDEGLEVTSGFFYGNTEMDHEETAELKKYFRDVLAQIKAKEAEYYYTCWY